MEEDYRELTTQIAYPFRVTKSPLMKKWYLEGRDTKSVNSYHTIDNRQYWDITMYLHTKGYLVTEK